MIGIHRGGHDVVLVTDAPRSYLEELAVRKRRYGILMAFRIPCLLLAATLYHIPWLAVAILALSIPLPWMAVLIANDRLPRSASRVERPTRQSDAQAMQVGYNLSEDARGR
ncbi:MAG: hypothetical protein QOG57_678 [Pseudonocardiales bacterium]|nr:hypothetical protein [Pseudonocardiales bacterium]